jgi:hypothetical protein
MQWGPRRWKLHPCGHEKKLLKKFASMRTEVAFAWTWRQGKKKLINLRPSRGKKEKKKK